jgi:hypothetical protein
MLTNASAGGQYQAACMWPAVLVVTVGEILLDGPVEALAATGVSIITPPMTAAPAAPAHLILLVFKMVPLHPWP